MARTPPAASPSASAPPAAPGAEGAAGELGIVARFPGFAAVDRVGDHALLRGCVAGKLKLELLDADLIHGRNLEVQASCSAPTVLGDLVVYGTRDWSSVPVAVHVPSGAVEPFAFMNVQDFIHVGDRVVLARCDGKPARSWILTILEKDRLHGRDVPTGKPCAPLDGIVGDAVVVGPRGSAIAVHVPSGTITPYVAADGARLAPVHPPDSARETTIGPMRYRFSSDPSVDPDGALEALDLKSDQPLWRAPLWGEASLPVLSRGNLLVRTVDTLLELDSRTGKVLWERGLPGDASLVALSLDGVGSAGAVAVVAAGAADAEPTEVVLFKRGAAPEAPWTGKIAGRVAVSDRSASKGKQEPIWVFAGSARARTDAHGNYELSLTSGGRVTVHTAFAPAAGVTAEKKVVDLVAGHGPYKVDLKVELFDQACQ